jgi:CRISPR-associated protein Csb2
MSSFLCLTVRYLHPYCHGRGDGGAPEWPPSPLRLFQALVAAAAGRWNERIQLQHAAPALRWLESKAPSIVAATGVPSEVKYRLYVPDNTADLAAGAWCRGDATRTVRRTEKDVRPTRLTGDAVHYLFPLANGECPHVDVLTAAASSITHLGWGIDMVAANAAVISAEEAGKLPGQRWLPTDGASAGGLRVPVQGTLDDLAAKHTACLQRLSDDTFKPVPPLSAYRVLGYRPATAPAPRPFAAFRLLTPDAERNWTRDAIRAIAVAGMVRSLAGKMARQTAHHEPDRDLDSWVNEYVMGHGEANGLRPRFSYLPLLTIRPPNILGGINRVIIAEPPGGSGEHVAWSRRALRGQLLLSKEGHEEALLLGADSDRKVLPRYIGASKTWATVTPVVLPGSDEGKFTKAEKLFFKALGHAGYSPDALADLEFRNVSFWAGGDLALRFHRPDYLKKDCWSVYHVRLRWKHEIKGPIALGAGRHCGLGTFAATTL